MNRPSSQYLTHLYPAWSGCTLNEIIIIWGACLTSNALGLIFLGLLIDSSLVGFFSFLLWIPLSYIEVKALLKIMEPIKERKQTGYVVIKMRLFLAKHMGFDAPYLTRLGRWTARC